MSTLDVTCPSTSHCVGMKPHLFNSSLGNISAAFFKIILEDSLSFKRSLNKNLHDLHMDVLEKEYTMSLEEIEMSMRIKQLTLEETWVKVFTNSYEMEVGRRERGDHHNEYLHQQKEKNRKEMARQEAKQKDHKESVTNEPKQWKIQEEQLKKETHQWEKVMMVKEEPIRRLTANGPRKQQQHRGREEVCRSRSEEEVSFKCLNCEQGRRKPVLRNNWVGEDESDSKPVKEHSNLTMLKSGRMYCISFVSLLLNTVHSYKQSLFVFVLKKQPH